MAALKVAIQISVIMGATGILAVCCVILGRAFQENSYCKTPESTAGYCMPLHFCTPLTKLLQKGASRKDNALLGYDFEAIEKYVCEGNRVCCPRSQAVGEEPNDLMDLPPLEAVSEKPDSLKLESSDRILKNAEAYFDFPWLKTKISPTVRIRPICLPVRSEPQRSDVVTGWSLTGKDGNHVSEHTVRLLNSKFCEGNSGGPIQIGSAHSIVVFSEIAFNYNSSTGINAKGDGYFDWKKNDIKPLNYYKLVALEKYTIY